MSCDAHSHFVAAFEHERAGEWAKAEVEATEYLIQASNGLAHPSPDEHAAVDRLLERVRRELARMHTTSAPGEVPDADRAELDSAWRTR